MNISQYGADESVIFCCVFQNNQESIIEPERVPLQSMLIIPGLVSLAEPDFCSGHFTFRLKGYVLVVQSIIFPSISADICFLIRNFQYSSEAYQFFSQPLNIQIVCTGVGFE